VGSLSRSLRGDDPRATDGIAERATSEPGAGAGTICRRANPSYPPAMAPVRRLPDILALRPDHDAFLVDVWGVLHAGGPLHAGVVETLVALRESGARVLFLSNSSRLGTPMAESLVALGLPRDVFVEVLSSGDVTREALVRRDDAVFALCRCGPSPRVLHVGNPGFVPWLFELGLDFVDDALDLDLGAAPELIVATGVPATRAALEAERTRLAPLAARKIPLVCTNPDPLIPSPSGKVVLGPGAVARMYADLGGPTFLFGKPHAPIYREAMRRLDVAPERIVAIGDMLPTDIAGARAAGIRSVLVTTGVHASEVGDELDQHDGRDDAVLEALFSLHGARPDAVIERFGRAASAGGRS
jgi:HAD superfamily hydrolase (TIGR01459 family)